MTSRLDVFEGDAGDARLSCSDWGFTSLTHTQQTLLRRGAPSKHSRLSTFVFSGPWTDARRQTFSSVASVRTSSLHQLIEPNPLLIFPQRAAFGPDS